MTPTTRPLPIPRVDPAESTWIGVDVGGTNVKVVVLAAGDPELVVLDTAESPTRGDTSREILAHVAAIAERLRREYPSTSGLGVSLPGAVNRLTGVSGTVPNLPGPWRGLPVRDILRTHTDLPVSVVNDARAFTLAEARYGAGRSHRIVVGVTLGTGLGNGLAIDGTLLESMAGMSGGDLGHVVIAAPGDACSCGGRGCAETLASTKVLIRDAGMSPVKAVFEAAHGGDIAAAAAIEAYAEHVATALANVHTLICPDVFVIGGGIAAAGDQILQPLGTALRARVRFDDPENVHLARAELGHHAGAVGAALLASTSGTPVAGGGVGAPRGPTSTFHPGSTSRRAHADEPLPADPGRSSREHGPRAP